MASTLSGKTIIVTGAGSGIGRATARLLAAEGAAVFATDRNAEGLAETIADADGSITTQVHDVTEQRDWDRLFGLVGERSDALHGLVNNAGIMLAGPFDQSSIEDLRLQYRINVEGPYMGMIGALPLMRRSRRANGGTASIVNVSSIFGQIAGSRYAAYSASKGAILMLSKAVAVELAAEGIRVNTVHPGPTATQLGASHAPPLDERGRPMSREQVVAMWQQRIPARRFGQADEIAATIAFLLGDAASYVNGAEIVVDGAYSAC
ncbi:MAG: SDR family oxidoreductase [Burkholderiaceae bacterium]